jgi:hypothetical protein
MSVAAAKGLSKGGAVADSCRVIRRLLRIRVHRSVPVRTLRRWKLA